MDRFLLHVCCAPCSIAVIDELRQSYDLTLFFYNPNIYPEAEYLKRKSEVVRIATEWNIPMIDGDYEPAVWAEAVRGREDAPEGGIRCQSCITLRLTRTAEEAKKREIKIFGTTLTMGWQKRAGLIFPIGERAAIHTGIRFYAEDWKKKGREEKARQMVKERNIYRQNYCGCRYSLLRKLNLD